MEFFVEKSLFSVYDGGLKYYRKLTEKRGLTVQYLLYNPMSGGGNCKALAENYMSRCEWETKLVDMTEIDSYSTLFKILNENDSIVVFGGDGTLNRFVNDIKNIEHKSDVYYYPAGTGNDFAADLDKTDTDEPFLINEYIKALPSVTVNGKTTVFINGVGYGIDGYCCEIGDKLRAQNKKANYTAIAIKGLLFHFKPVNAAVVVDGVEHNYKKVWIAPTMNGRHYGGGMIPTPEQSRTDTDGKLSLMVFHGSGKLKTLMIFPSIFTGEHIKNTKCVEVLTGKDITVKFDRPTPLQIDGETVLDVTEYHAVSCVKAKKEIMA